MYLQEPSIKPNIQKPQSAAKILIVDDVPENLHLLLTALTQEGYDVRNAINGKLAMMGVIADKPELILLDINMPGMNGFEVCQKLKANTSLAEIPIIFISAMGEVFDKVKAFEVGGADYITKPFQLAEVLARVRHQLELSQLKKQLNQQNQELRECLKFKAEAEAKVHQLNQVLEQRVLERTLQLQKANLDLNSEMEQRQKAQAKMLHFAMHDPLTKLANRRQLLEQIKARLTNIRQIPFPQVLLLIDCDRLTTINETLGPLLGDQMLIQISNCLRASIKELELTEKTLIARLSRDEFAILLSTTPGINIESIIDTLRQNLAESISLDEFEIIINASFGVINLHSDYKKAEHLLRDGCRAMERAKQERSGSWQVFQPTMHQQALRHLSLESKLRKSIELQQLQVYYQPIVALSAESATRFVKESHIIGLEALLRWQLDENTFISPGEFIPIAESTGLILPMGEYVLETACHQLREWNRFRTKGKELFMCVNFSVHQLNQPQIIDTVQTVLQRTQCQPQWLKLEVTESVFMSDLQKIIKTLNQLRNLGIKISIDDFGSGYSSLNYLKQLPVDTLKIDRTFVWKLETEPENLNIIEVILKLARNLNLNVVAEGIETEYQAQQLVALTCEEGQGYWFAKPMSHKQVEQLLGQQ